MTPIQAIDTRIMPYPVDDIWAVLINFAEYPRWWPRSVGLSVLNVEPGLVGTAFQLRPLGGRSFCCRVESIERPHQLRMRYYGGFIEGIGEWRLGFEGQHACVQYALDVKAAGRLVALLARILPLNRFHSIQMQGVLRQLEKVVQKNQARQE